ncbi:MAG: DegT/DnrJ/EryC1/StrS family aminotransferase [Alphaproteobacteria bacterium]
MKEAIAFIDLQAQRRRLGDRPERAMQHVLDHGRMILGPEVDALEEALCAFSGAAHAVTCANGTDAITLALMAEEIGAGDVVFMPAFTFVATAEAPAQLGAVPYFVDVDEASFNIDAASLEAGIEDALARGLRPRAIIAVDLFGQSADYAALRPIAERHGLVLIADAAQSFGGTIDGRRVGSFGDYTTTSFFPAKPLGGFGDGGAVFTADADKADLLRSLRAHGKGGDRYDNVRIGLNSRLDTLQAAVLLEKLRIFEDELAARHEVALRYNRALDGWMTVPVLGEGRTSSWAQYTLRHADRDALMSALRSEGIPTAIYYPRPLNRQRGYLAFPSVPGGVPVADRLSEDVFSLPMHAYLSADQQARITDALLSALADRQEIAMARTGT